MNGRDFFFNVEKHESLNWLGVVEGRKPEDDRVIVGNTRGARFSLEFRAILDHEWDELELVLTGKRQPRIMMQLSRIVGYFSQVANWNKSKLAELKDRHKGMYDLSEEPAPPKTSPKLGKSPLTEPALAAASD